MNSDDRYNERCKQRLYEKMGTNHPVCIASGATDWQIFEGHHVAGRRFDAHVEYFSADMHRRFTHAQKSRPGPTSDSPGTGERAGHYCVGLADILSPVARVAEGFGHGLVKLADSEDIRSETAKALIRGAGYFLIALAGFLERVGQRLEHYGDSLIDEASRAQPGSAKRQRQSRKSGTKRAGPSRRARR